MYQAGIALWLARTNLVASIGGGAIGLFAVIAALQANPSVTRFAILVYLLAAAFFTYGVVLGIRLAEGRDIRFGFLIFYGLQIPQISTSILSFHINAGANIVGQLSASGFRMSGGFGSDFSFHLWQVMPWQIGLNVLPVILLLAVAMTNRPE